MNGGIKNNVMTDPIADYLTRLRNAIKANHRIVEMPASNMKKEITKVLKEQGFITRVSKPGLRKYAGAEALPRVLNGLGIAIMSTSKGVITNKKAKELHIGGEVLCYVY